MVDEGVRPPDNGVSSVVVGGWFGADSNSQIVIISL